MTKDEAREVLNMYVLSDSFTELPINDVKITYIRPKTIEEVDLSWTYEEYPNAVLEDFTFKGLIKIAYDL